ncbi:MAG: hypothetical protein ABIC04_04290 [Nanoarchaeota archaeon]
MKTISREIPIAEITIRKYEKSDNLEGRELVRKLCLSLGLLQKGDSRDIIVDVLFVFLWAKKGLSTEEIVKWVKEERKRHKLDEKGITLSNIMRQIKRLKGILLVEKTKNTYKITEKLTITEIFEEKIVKFIIEPTVARIKEYTQKIDESYKL